MNLRLIVFLLIISFFSACNQTENEGIPGPIDPQIVQDQDDMTLSDYNPIPGMNWADPDLVLERGFRIALVAIDFDDQPFVMTKPKKSDLFGNPQINPVAREDIPQLNSLCPHSLRPYFHNSLGMRYDP